MAITDFVTELTDHIGGKLDKIHHSVSHTPKPIYRKITQSQENTNGNGAADLGQPAAGRFWVVRGLQAFENLNGTPAPNTGSATGAAGAAVNVTMPFYTPFITGFSVSTGVATAAGQVTITVTGPGQPTLTYYLEESTTSSEVLTVNYPAPGIQGYTEVSVSALANGGTVAVNVTGVTTGTPANLVWYTGAYPQSEGTAELRANVLWLPAVNEYGQVFPEDDKFGLHERIVLPDEHLFAVYFGGISGENYVFSAFVEEWEVKDRLAVKA